MIKLDPSIQVDVPLLNALMDAFARVGAYAESFEVWDELVERRPRERQEDLVDLYSPSINIYLDACGHSYSLLRARKAWAWAGKWGLNKDQRNWEAWLECLCRCGRVEEAVETVQKIKKGSEKGAPGVTKGMVALLLKFSWRNKETYRTVKEQVRVEFPEYWEELKDIVATKSTSADE
jgi:pentatricopeptide repeat protein